jgi:hypothetical protein
MKTIIFILALSLSSSYITAQEVTLKKGMNNIEMVKGTYYKTDATLLNKYLGYWEHTTSGSVFKFKIFRKKTPVQGVYIDRLKAQYCFGKECDVESINTSILTSAENDTMENLDKGTLRFRFWDYTYEKFGVIEFKLIQKNKAYFKLRESYNPNNDIQGFSVPTEMILTRTK